MTYRILLFLGLLFYESMAYSQSNERTGVFYLTKIGHKFSNRWSAYIENQWRSLDGLQKFYYYELKGAATWTLNKNYSFTLGTGIYETFGSGAEYEDYSKQFENRIWQQVAMKHRLSVIKIEHRYRIEQRFKSGYENRFRYRLKADVPLNSRKIQPKTFFVSVYDELFFTGDIPNFVRNRFQFGAGFVFSDAVNINMGWLRQVDFSRESMRKKDYVYTALSIRI